MTNTTITEPLSEQLEEGGRLSASMLLLNETAIWLSTQQESCRICGNLENEGIVIEWHSFQKNADSTSELPHSCYPESLELCLNLAGHGFLQSRESTLSFEPQTAFLYAVGKRDFHTSRKYGESHRFLTINFSADFLREHLMECEGALHAFVSGFMSSGHPNTALGKPFMLTSEHGRLVSQLLSAQCAKGACRLRCKGIVLQLMADFLVEPCCTTGASCDQQTCLAKKRVRGVVAILQRDLAEPPGLEAMGREIGCSPFYLSRIFSKETGMTIPQCLRTLRMRYAAALLKSGRCNVTEAAMEVGYSSMSHFSQAFCKAVGCCPTAYSSQSSAQDAANCTTERSPSQLQRLIDGKFTEEFDPQIDVLLQSIR